MSILSDFDYTGTTKEPSKNVNSFGYKLGQALGALVAICLGALFVTITIVLMCKIWTFAF